MFGCLVLVFYRSWIEQLYPPLLTLRVKPADIPPVPLKNDAHETSGNMFIYSITVKPYVGTYTPPKSNFRHTNCCIKKNNAVVCSKAGQFNAFFCRIYYLYRICVAFRVYWKDASCNDIDCFIFFLDNWFANFGPPCLLPSKLEAFAAGNSSRRKSSYPYMVVSAWHWSISLDNPSL